MNAIPTRMNAIPQLPMLSTTRFDKSFPDKITNNVLVAVVLLSAAVSLAVTVHRKLLTGHLSVYTVLFLESSAYFAILLATIPFFRSYHMIFADISRLPSRTFALILGIAVLSVIAAVFWMNLVPKMSAGRLTMIDYAVDILFTVVGSWLFLREEVTPNKIGGAMSLIMALYLLR
jgi:drug/metabolite transporter (DMT)-like permease